MPRSPNRIREDAHREAQASPRVGDVHRRRVCARCGSSTLATRMKIANSGRWHLFYQNWDRRDDGRIEAWLCQACSAYLGGYGVLRA